jgi:hypothetical protein
MYRFTDPSDFDYYDPGRRGIECTCAGCGDEVWVGRDEPHQGRVYCERCQQEPPHCIWCGAELTDREHFHYCSLACSIRAEQDMRRG